MPQRSGLIIYDFSELVQRLAYSTLRHC